MKQRPGRPYRDDAPTFNPSFKSSAPYWIDNQWAEKICHFYLKAGIYEYQKDCTYAMKGQNVPMVDFLGNYKI